MVRIHLWDQQLILKKSNKMKFIRNTLEAITVYVFLLLARISKMFEADDEINGQCMKIRIKNKYDSKLDKHFKFAKNWREISSLYISSLAIDAMNYIKN